jgi:hypothetical protein
MPQYVFQLWVTVEAKDLTDATHQAHHYAESLEADPYIDNVLIGDEYEKVINEYGDTIPAED